MITLQALIQATSLFQMIKQVINLSRNNSCESNIEYRLYLKKVKGEVTLKSKRWITLGALKKRKKRILPNWWHIWVHKQTKHRFQRIFLIKRLLSKAQFNITLAQNKFKWACAIKEKSCFKKIKKIENMQHKLSSMPRKIATLIAQTNLPIKRIEREKPKLLSYLWVLNQRVKILLTRQNAYTRFQ